MLRLFLTLVVSALVLLPVTILAQDVPPSRFYGGAFVDGQPAAVGTRIEAMAGGMSLGAMTVETAGLYRLDVSQPPGDLPISFHLNGYEAEVKGSWDMGSFTKLTLWASSGPAVVEILPTPTAAAVAPAAQRVPGPPGPQGLPGPQGPAGDRGAWAPPAHKGLPVPKVLPAATALPAPMDFVVCVEIRGCRGHRARGV